MEKVQLIFYLISALIGILCTAVPTSVALVKSIKAKKNAKTAEHAAKADLDIKNHMVTLIAEVEDIYAVVDTALKAIGGSAGSVKKETVMARLQQFALDNNYAFDKDKWSVEIDETVAVTKVVNAKK